MDDKRGSSDWCDSNIWNKIYDIIIFKNKIR